MFKRLIRTVLKSLSIFALCCSALAVYANPTPIILWHSMAGGLGTTLNAIIQEFNSSQSNYKVVPLYKGDYPETLTATIAAFRAKQQPNIVQVFEVGTAL